MGVLDKFLDIMRLNPDDDDDELYNDDYYEEEEDSEYKKRSSSRTKKNIEEESKSSRSNLKSSQKITPMRPAKRQTANGMEVCVIKPVSIEDSREITETLLSNRAVILNVEGLDLEVSQRIIDFASGSCFAIGGNLQKISTYIFIIAPASVDISGDFLSIIDTLNPTSLQSNI